MRIFGEIFWTIGLVVLLLFWVLFSRVGILVFIAFARKVISAASPFLDILLLLFLGTHHILSPQLGLGLLFKFELDQLNFFFSGDLFTIGS